MADNIKDKATKALADLQSGGGDPEELRAIFTTLCDEHEAEFAGWADQFRYDGFDPRATFATLLETLAKSSTKESGANIMTALLFYIMRGNNVSDKGLTKDGIKLKGKIMTALSIKKRADSSKGLTFPRIAAVLPYHLAFLAAKRPNLKVDPVPYQEGTLPKCLRFPSCVSLIPWEELELKAKFDEWHAAWSDIINKGQAQDLAKSAQLVELVWRSELVIKNEDRRALLKSLKDIAREDQKSEWGTIY